LIYTNSLKAASHDIVNLKIFFLQKIFYFFGETHKLYAEHKKYACGI